MVGEQLTNISILLGGVIFLYLVLIGQLYGKDIKVKKVFLYSLLSGVGLVFVSIVISLATGKEVTQTLLLKEITNANKGALFGYCFILVGVLLGATKSIWGKK